MSAIAIGVKGGATYYTKDYDTPRDVRSAIDRGEELTCFWFAGWGKRFQESFLFLEDSIGVICTERDIP